MSNQCLQIGELLRGSFALAKGMRADLWHREHWETFRKLAKAWIDEFRALEPTFERLPDGWAEMAAIEGDLSMGTVPVLLDSEITESEKQEWQAKADQRLVVDTGELWLPLWAKLFPAIRGHRAIAPPDGPVGDRGWRHKGILIEGLNGRQPMEVMRELQDKPIGFAYLPDPNRLSPKKLAQLINQNCRSIGLPWNVRALQGLGIVKVKERPKKGS